MTSGLVLCQNTACLRLHAVGNRLNCAAHWAKHDRVDITQTRRAKKEVLMARVTVEDCLENVDNRFELVMVASERARRLANYGKDPMVPVENDKPTVVALREIAEGHVDASILDEPKHEEVPEITLGDLPQDEFDRPIDPSF